MIKWKKETLKSLFCFEIMCLLAVKENQLQLHL